MTCCICTEDYTKHLRRKVVCINNECDSEYCIQCFKNYLLKSEEYEQKCMMCSASYSLKDIFTQYNSTGFIKDVMLKITEIAYNTEKTLLPNSQDEALRIIKRRNFMIWRKPYDRDCVLLIREIDRISYNIRNINDRIKKTNDRIELKNIRKLKKDLAEKKRSFKRELQRIKDVISIEHNKAYYNNGASGEKVEENNYTFIKECSWPDCNGMLEKNWRCPLCEKFTCAKCHEPRDKEHECNEDIVKTISSFKTDTKPCPKCGYGIFKIDGCFAADTKIMTWDGDFKFARDIIVGDELIGDDGKKRTVLETTNGQDTMYEISQEGGESYIVNSKHKLALKYQDNKKIFGPNRYGLYKVKWFSGIIRSLCFKDYEDAEKFINTQLTDIPDIYELYVEDYLRLKDWEKRLYFKGCKLNTFIDWEYQLTELEPYDMGCLIGDKYLPRGYLKSHKDIDLNQWKTNIEERLKFDEIPINYIKNSKEVRLELLAGIIDTKGMVYKCGRKIKIFQIKHIIEQIIFLVQSLGFSYKVLKEDNGYYEINIDGSDEIPSKKFDIVNGNPDLLLSKIRIKKLEKDNYYGFSIDGNKRFLLYDFTIARNCDQMYCTSCHTAFSWRTGKIEKGNIHNPEYFRYMRENKINIPRNPNDGRGFEINECFNLLNNTHQVTLYIGTMLSTRCRLYNTIVNLIRMAGHFNDIVLRRYVHNIEHKMSALRVKYLLKDINIERWKASISTNIKIKHRDDAQHTIIDTFVKIMCDIIMNIIYIMESKCIDIKDKLLEQFNCLEKYANIANIELYEIRQIFKSQSKQYFTFSRNYVKDILDFSMRITYMDSDVVIENQNE